MNFDFNCSKFHLRQNRQLWGTACEKDPEFASVPFLLPPVLSAIQMNYFKKLQFLLLYRIVSKISYNFFRSFVVRVQQHGTVMLPFFLLLGNSKKTFLADSQENLTPQKLTSWSLYESICSSILSSSLNAAEKIPVDRLVDSCLTTIFSRSRSVVDPDGIGDGRGDGRGDDRGESRCDDGSRFSWSWTLDCTAFTRIP